MTFYYHLQEQTVPDNSFVKDLFLKKEAKTLFSAGFLDASGNLTLKGRYALQSVALEKNMKEMLDLAEKELKDNE